MNKHKNPFELHESRLGSTDEDGHRLFIFPEDVKGIWRKRRSIFYWLLILLYLALPWIHVGGKQSILLDIEAREFVFFGNSFMAHNAPLFLFLLLAFVFAIGFITSIWGRVWCGWACPQTVFIDAIYRNIEILVEGKARARQKLEQAPWNLEKLAKRTLKWTLYLVASLHIAHSFLGYFVGARKLFWITMGSPSEHLTLFTSMLIITFILIADFGWFREQFCIIACPYGRMQSVIMDNDSLIVAYDVRRGEPRRQPGMDKGQHGDCINCYACVRACPTGIDIRRGTQMECIACTNCIDACDEIMDKVGSPHGLIRYDTQNALDGVEGHILRPRNIIYLLALIGIIIGFLFALDSGQHLGLVVLRASNAPFSEIHMTSGEREITNQFKFVFDNEAKAHLQIGLEVIDTNIGNLSLVTPQNPFTFDSNQKKVNVFFRFSPDLLSAGKKMIQVGIYSYNQSGVKTLYETREVLLVGPLN